jgi:hypothetical protein
MKRPQLAVPAAAACAALLFSGCTNGSTNAEPGASTGPSLTTMPADEAAALAVIDQAYAAFNSGDAARWAAARSAGGEYESDEARDAELAEATQFFEERIAAGVRFTAIQCVSHGEGQWAGIADAQAPAVQGYNFTCEHNDGSGTHVTKWLVADDKVVAAGSD